MLYVYIFTSFSLHLYHTNNYIWFSNIFLNNLSVASSQSKILKKKKLGQILTNFDLAKVTSFAPATAIVETNIHQLEFIEDSC